MIKINGENIAADGRTIEEYITDKGYDKSRIAVELNERIVSKSDYKNIVLKDGDTVEVVNFVGGG